MLSLGRVYKDEVGHYVVAHDSRNGIIEWHFYKSQSDIIDDNYIYKEYWRALEVLEYKNLKGV